MADQKTLFEPGPATGTLTDRQAFVYGLLQQAGAGNEWAWSPDEIGAMLCHRRGKHEPDERCDFDTQNGNEVLRALRAKELAKQRRGRGWVALNGPPPESAPSPSNDFPEGY